VNITDLSTMDHWTMPFELQLLLLNTSAWLSVSDGRLLQTAGSVMSDLMVSRNGETALAKRVVPS